MYRSFTNKLHKKKNSNGNNERKIRTDGFESKQASPTRARKRKIGGNGMKKCDEK